MRAEADYRVERLQRDFPARRPRRWRRADRVAALEAAAVQPRPVDAPDTAAVVLVAAEVRAVIEAHIRVPAQRPPGSGLPDRVPQTSMAHPGQ